MLRKFGAVPSFLQLIRVTQQLGSQFAGAAKRLAKKEHDDLARYFETA